LRRQLLSRKAVVKLYLRTPLHAKLYLCYKDDVNVPVVGFVGSSNLTFAGLSNQGELNVDVLDQDAAKKLSTWFQERWRALDFPGTVATVRHAEAPSRGYRREPQPHKS
jgi:phosphatidylserine/phosphatidylglycerophosphate/cardiolipin synthase-like enzyme